MNSKKKNTKGSNRTYRNPFNISAPIENPENFFGRKEEMNSFFDLIFQSNYESIQSISIVGERKIGKTSFTKMLLHEEILKSHEIDANKYILIYLNIAERRPTSQEHFLKQILQKLAEKENLDTSQYESEDDIYSKIIGIADEIRHKKKIIFFLDEFEAICEIWDTKFGGWLRALSQEHGVGFVTVTLKPLAKIQCKTNGKIEISPFYNIFQDFVLGLLDESSSKEMINKMFKRGGIELDTDETRLLLEITGGNPFFVQLFGSLYFEKRKKEKKDQIDLKSFRKEAFMQGEKHFEQYWKNLDEKERKYLMMFREGQNSSNSFVEYDLDKRGILGEKEGKFFYFSPLFGQFVQKYGEETNISSRQRLKNLLSKIQKSYRIIRIILFLPALILLLAFFILGGSESIIGFIASLLAGIFILLLQKSKNR